MTPNLRDLVLVDCGAYRDAVHIPVILVEALADISPGDPLAIVGRKGDGENAIPLVLRFDGRKHHRIAGIASPWLLTSPFTFARRGERFLMLMHPDTVSQVRHQWTCELIDGNPLVNAAERLREKNACYRECSVPDAAEKE